MIDRQTWASRPRLARARRAAVPALSLAALSWVAGCAIASATTRPQSHAWIATWATSPQAFHVGPEGPKPHVAGRTVRERMRVTFGGDEVRVRLSNEFGKTPLVIGGASIGVPTAPGTVAPGSLRALTFSGHRSIVVPPGAPVLSDPVKMRVPPGSDVSVSIYLPQTAHLPLTMHALGLRTAVISPPGNYIDTLRMPQASRTDSSVFVTQLLVPREPGQALIVAFGDSITDGDRSTVNALRNWPEDFERRLVAAGLGQTLAIVNEGISGNQLRHDFAGVSAQARFDRDVLAIPGARYVIVLEGINDIGFPGVSFMGRTLEPASAMPTAEDIIEAYRQLIARAHAQGLEIFGGTLTPFKGTFAPYYTPAKNRVREQVNRWIRTGGAFDGVIDFDAALRDPSHPQRYLPLYSSSDHLHPSDAGYQRMADTVSLALFHH